jgi:hypothetical protein
LNVLECSNELLNQALSDYSTNFKWNYVSFLGASVQSIRTNSFENINLAENATIILENVELSESDIFSNDTLKEVKFRLVIQNSSLNSLGFMYPFRFARLSQLEFIDCFFDERFAVLAFDGVQVDAFLIKKVQAQSQSPLFRFGRTTKTPVIRKLQLINIYETFSQNSFINLFAIDGSFLNTNVFSGLEELEIRNTRIDQIDGEIFTLLKKLKTVRLENVNLTNVIEGYYSILFDSNNDQQLTHWISSNTSIQKVFLGHEFSQSFNFENKFLCYFLEQTEATTVFIYDNLDTPSGVECTCTIFWIYRYFDFVNTEQKYGDDLKYIPNCIKKMKNRNEVKERLNVCLDGREPVDFCKAFLNSGTTTLATTTRTSSTTTKLTSTQTQTTLETTSSTTNVSNDAILDYLKKISITQLIIIIIITGLLVVFAFAILVFMFKIKRLNLTRNNKVSDNLTKMEHLSTIETSL